MTTLGITLLRIAPLLSATGTLTHALCELNQFSALLHPRVLRTDDAIARVLPPYFVSSFNRAVCSVLFFNFLSTAGAVANLATGAATLKGVRGYAGLSVRGLYGLGLAGTVGHLCFVPLVAGPVKRLFELADKGGKGASASADHGHEAEREMRRWLQVHKIRMSTVDTIAWLAYAGAVAGWIASKRV